MKDAILASISQPVVASVVLVAGWISVIAEFLLPGRAVFGALGGVLIVLSLWGLLPEHVGLACAVVVGMTACTIPLLRIAWRARRNKLAGE